MQYREKLEVVAKKKINGLPQEPTLSQEILAWDSEPQRSLSEEVTIRKCYYYSNHLICTPNGIVFKLNFVTYRG